MTKRYLGPTESLFLDGGMTAICVVELAGDEVGAELIDEAFGVLADENPVLRSRVESDDDGRFIRPVAGWRPAVTVRTGVEDPIGLEANSPLDPLQALSRLTLYREDDGGSVVALAIHHSFTDGVMVTLLANRLLTYYTVLASGRTLIAARRDEYEQPLDALVDKGLGPAAPPRLDGPVTTFPRATGVSAGAPIAVHGLRFDRRETEALIGNAKRIGLSPFGLFSGAAAATLPAADDTDAPRTVTVWTLVSLRERLHPPVAQDANLFCAGLAVLALHCDDPHDHVGFGTQAMERLKTALADNVPERMVVTMSERGPAGFPPISFTMSNTGRFAGPELPAGLRMVAQRGIVPPDPRSPIPTIIIVTIDGRLGLDVVYSRAALDENRIAEWVDGIRSIVLAPVPG